MRAELLRARNRPKVAEVLLGPGWCSVPGNGTGSFRDMVVTHLFQILAFMAMEPASANRQRQVRDPQVGPVPRVVIVG